MDIEFSISYNFHLSQILLIFFQPFKSIKKILKNHIKNEISHIWLMGARGRRQRLRTTRKWLIFKPSEPRPTCSSSLVPKCTNGFSSFTNAPHEGRLWARHTCSQTRCTHTFALGRGTEGQPLTQGPTLASGRRGESSGGRTVDPQVLITFFSLFCAFL